MIPEIFEIKTYTCAIVELIVSFILMKLGRHSTCLVTFFEDQPLSNPFFGSVLNESKSCRAR